MTTKRMWIIQPGDNAPTPWDDAIATANTAVNFSLGSSLNASDAEHVISFFQRVDTRFVLDKGRDSDFILDKPYSPGGETVTLKFNLDEISSRLDTMIGNGQPTITTGLGATLVYGCRLQGPMSQEDVVKNSTCFTRQADGKIVDLINNVVIEDKWVNIIPWFFCYRTDDTPFYFIVTNPHSIQVIGEIDGDYGDNKVFTADSHFKGINELIFKPKISKNGHQVGNSIVASGDTLTITPFDNWFVNSKIPGFFKNAKVKCHSNFDYEQVDNAFKFKLKGNVGYIHMRWNSGTVMNTTFYASGSVFSSDFVVHIIKE